MPASSQRVRARACAGSLALAFAAAGAAASERAVATYAPAYFAAQHPETARDMIERLPGFQLESGASVRGFEGAAGNVLIDGQRPTAKNDSLSDILGRIPAGKVARIDVVRGGSPGIDMQGRPVVANVLLRKDGALRGQAAVEAQHVGDGRAFAGLNAQASGGVGERKWEVSALWGRGYSSLAGPGASRTTAPDDPRTALVHSEDDGTIQQATGAYELPGLGGSLRLNAHYYGNHLKFEEDARDLATGALRSTDQTAREDDRELGLRFTRPLPARATLELVGLYQDNASEIASNLHTMTGGQRFDLDQRTRETIGRAVVKSAWSRTVNVELGAETARNRLRSDSAFAVDGVDVPLPDGEVSVREDRAQAFAKVGWRASDRLSLDGALIYERSEVASAGDVRLAKTLAYLKPRLVAAWSPDADTQLRLRLEREVGQLNFNDFVAQASLNTDTGVTAGNVDLEPERAWLFEAALERRFWSRGSVILTARRYAISGVADRGPVFAPGGVFDRPSNIGDGRKDVLRADLTLPLEKAGLKDAQLKGYVVKRWSKVDDPTTGDRRQISGLRHIEWEAHFTQDLPARNLSWGVSAYGGWQVYYFRFNAVDEVKLDPYLMVFGEWRPRPGLSLRAELGNLTDRGYRRVTLTYPGPKNGGAAPSLTERETYLGHEFFFRLRRTFGG
jgi:outer membrane receptor protein involved in Fe transport